MLRFRAVAFALLAVCAGATATATETTPRLNLPPGVTLPRDVQLPQNVTVAVYLPARDRKSRLYVPTAGYWLEFGKALENGFAAALQQFFSGGFLAEPSSEQTYGLLVSVHPKWAVESGNLRMTMDYKVYGADSTLLLEGKQSFAARLNLSSSVLYNTAFRAAQLVAVDITTKLHPGQANHATVNRLKDVKRELLVDRDKPVATGTGFYINGLGQVMTAAHVLEDCVLTEAKRDDKVMSARTVVSSTLLDLAVIDTGSPSEHFLPLRRGSEVVLGEPVANVGYPLQSILAASPNLTRGNVSSRGALEGSVGQFQFSAPIQPGSSGGPVVSDGGELLGITTSTLNVAPLIEKGVLPQNVNFALDARYAAMFLHKNSIPFTEVEPNFKGDMRSGNDAALATVVRLACYQ